MNQNAKQQPPDIPSLTKLREMGFGARLAPQTQAQNWLQVRPGHQRKIYGGPAQKCRWVYMPKVIEGEELKSQADIAALADARPLDDLVAQIEADMKQLLIRAHTGDRRAILLCAAIVRRAVRSLERLAIAQPDTVQTVAETHPRWPVLLSLNPQDIKQAKDQLRRLHVGQKAETPTRPGQRLDPHNFWTLLADRALNVCQINRVLVPILEAHCGGTFRERKEVKFWGRVVGATYHYLPNRSEVIIIVDWQKQCASLSEQITPANFNAWWDVIKACVLEHWKNPRGNYAEALKTIGQPDKEEWRRRSMALDRVRQALESLTHLQ